MLIPLACRHASGLSQVCSIPFCEACMGTRKCGECIFGNCCMLVCFVGLVLHDILMARSHMGVHEVSGGQGQVCIWCAALQRWLAVMCLPTLQLALPVERYSTKLSCSILCELSSMHAISNMWCRLEGPTARISQHDLGYGPPDSSAREVKAARGSRLWAVHEDRFVLKCWCRC